MSITIPPATNTEEFSGNIIRPFQLESSVLRGRIVSFNSVLDDILIPHDYPQAVSNLLGEVVTLCALLSSMLKFDGIFTLQTSSDGPVSMLVADMTSSGGIRACATFDEAKLEALKDNDFKSLVGQGYIAFTVDQGEHTERYQGIVELKGDTLVETIEHYFVQSEQIKTNIILGIEKSGNDKGAQWYSRGMIIQEMPKDGGHNKVDGSNKAEDTEEKSDVENIIPFKSEDWNRATILMDSCKQEELLDQNLNAHDLLLRLFHEEGVRVFPPQALVHQCRCSDEKVKNVYKMLSEDERKDIETDGQVEMTCDFCSKTYSFSAENMA